MLQTYSSTIAQMCADFFKDNVYNESDLQYFISIGALSEEDYQKIVNKNNGDKAENEASNETVVQSQAQ